MKKNMFMKVFQLFISITIVRVIFAAKKDKDSQQRATETLSQMTLDEKLSLM
jgi:hypothetical protein